MTALASAQLREPTQMAKLWNCYRWDEQARIGRTLGTVRAANQPEAILKALKKFRLTTNDEQRLLFVRTAAGERAVARLPDWPRRKP